MSRLSDRIHDSLTAEYDGTTERVEFFHSRYHSQLTEVQDRSAKGQEAAKNNTNIALWFMVMILRIYHRQGGQGCEPRPLTCLLLRRGLAFNFLFVDL